MCSIQGIYTVHNFCQGSLNMSHGPQGQTAHDSRCKIVEQHMCMATQHDVGGGESDLAADSDVVGGPIRTLRR
jgi:hypothetical protein